MTFIALSLFDIGFLKNDNNDDRIAGNNDNQKQPPRAVLKKSCSENMQQVYRRTPMPKSDFNK